jgi:hypothetical protein
MLKIDHKRTCISVVGIMFVMGTVACTAPSAAPVVATQEQTQEQLPPAPTPEATLELTPETRGPLIAIRPEGGFRTGEPIDASTLPTLAVPGVGVSGIFCDHSTSTEDIRLVSVVGIQYEICLFNWEITETGVPSLRITMTDPAGTSFTEDYTFGATDTYVSIVDSRGEVAGNVATEADLPPGMELFISIFVTIPPAAPDGAWTITAEAINGDKVVGPVSVTPDYGLEVIGLSPDPELHVLNGVLNWYTTDQVIYVTGAGYAPSTELTVAMYLQDPNTLSEMGTPTLLPQFATRVTTDASGKFAADFVVGANTPRGDYLAIAAPVFTTDLLFNPFVGGFKVQ